MSSSGATWSPTAASLRTETSSCGVSERPGLAGGCTRRPTGLLLPLPFPGAGAKKKNTLVGVFFVCSRPVPASNGASPSLAFRRGRSKKKTPWGVFFFALAPCRLPTGLLLPLPFPGAAAKKKTPWVVFFFFAAAPRGRSLTHCGPGWRCLPLAGAVFFFLLRPRPDRGGVFFLLWPRPDAHSLTVGWGDFGKARVVFFFLLRPRRVFLDNSKKCLGYYIGSKKTRRGHSFSCLSPGPEQKKNTLGGVFFFCSGPVPASNGASPSLAFHRGRSKKDTLGGVFFFCSGPVPASNGASPSLAFRRGRSKKKNPGWCFFFAAAPRGRSLTHCGPGWRCLPLAGAVFFFFCCGPARTGVVFFFFCCGPARTLTHSRWAGAISARPGWCFFFCCGPAGSF